MSDCTFSSDSEDLDRRIIAETQSGLPLVARPYQAVAERLGVSESLVMARCRAMLETGAIRRIAAVPNHYRLGFTANGMTVWDVDDEALERLGRQVGALPGVSHCYARPRHRPLWPYNLFAMLHGRSREEVTDRAEEIAALLGDACGARDILFSTRILKKTGLRLARAPSTSD